MEQWRLLNIDWLNYADTAILRPALMRARSEGIIPDTVSICTFSKPSAIITFFNDPDKEINLELCRKKGIEVSRLIIGGGPIFGDMGYMHTMLIVGRENPKLPENPTKMFEKTLTGIALGISDYFRVECRYRPLNDLEIRCDDGVWRKIGPSGCIYQDKAIQMTSAMQVKKNDADLIASIITPPKEKFLDKETKTLQDRITYLEKTVGRSIDWEEIKKVYRKQIEETFGVQLIPGDLTEKEKTYFSEMRKAYTSEEYFMERSERKFHPLPAGVVRKSVQFKVPEGPFARIILFIKDSTIWDIRISGMIHASPLIPTSPIHEIEKSLKGGPVDLKFIESSIEQVMSHPNFDIAKVSPKLLADKIYECATM